MRTKLCRRSNDELTLITVVFARNTFYVKKKKMHIHTIRIVIGPVVENVGFPMNVGLRDEYDGVFMSFICMSFNNVKFTETAPDKRNVP